MSKTFQKVAELKDVPEGQAKSFEIAGDKIVLCKVENEVFAVADLCSHDNAPLGGGELDDHQIECPRHGARFDIKTGKALCLPAITAIPVYDIELRGEEIWVGEKKDA